jgi:hypothetical protein
MTLPPLPRQPRPVKELNFKIIKEDWFIYKLKDGSILKVKPVLIKVFETDQVGPDGKKVLAFHGQNIVAVSSPENLKGTPTLPLPSPTDALKLDKEEVEIDGSIYDPQWNIYELENGQIIKSKIVIVHVYRIKGKYNEMGDPYYVVQSVTITGSSPEREVEPFQMSALDVYTFRDYELLLQRPWKDLLGNMATDYPGLWSANFGPLYTQSQPSMQHNSSLAPPYYRWPSELKLPIIKFREISVDELAKYLGVDEIIVEEELTLLLRSYEIPEELVGRVKTMIRNYIKSELEKRGLPVEDWILNPLYKLFIHIAYITLYV